MKRRYTSLAGYLEGTESTQDALADRLGISKSYVSLLVAGKRQPALALAIEIENITGVPVEALVASEVKAS